MIFIFLLALILFGPKRLPEMAREVGKFVAEFKRASNDFKYQLQAEIEKAGNEAPPAPQSGAPQAATQQTTAFTQTILPPAAQPESSAADEAHERLMKTARMAFDAQSFTLRPPQPPPVPATVGLQPTAPLPTPSGEAAAQSSEIAASHASSPVAAEAVTHSPAPQAVAAESSPAPQRS